MRNQTWGTTERFKVILCASNGEQLLLDAQISRGSPALHASTCFESCSFPRSTPAQHLEIEKWAKYLNDVRNALLEADGTRTLTGIYNDLTTLRSARDSTYAVYALLIAHERLDAAVVAAYGWDAPLSDDDILAKLLTLNLQRSTNSDSVDS